MVFIILFIQYYSVICRSSDHTVGRNSGAESRTRDGRFRGTDFKIFFYTFLSSEKGAELLECPITGGLDALKKGQMATWVAGNKVGYHPPKLPG